MATRMQQRRGTAAQWAAANPVLADGEVGYEKDTGVVKIGNGTSNWNQLTSILSGSYLTVNGKAYDADRLDGLDSTAFAQKNYVDDRVLPTGASRALGYHFGSVTAFPATAVGVKLGDRCWRSDLFCEFYYNGGVWRQSTPARMTSAQRVAITTAQKADLHVGFKMLETDTLFEREWDGRYWEIIKWHGDRSGNGDANGTVGAGIVEGNMPGMALFWNAAVIANNTTTNFSGWTKTHSPAALYANAGEATNPSGGALTGAPGLFTFFSGSGLGVQCNAKGRVRVQSYNWSDASAAGRSTVTLKMNSASAGAAGDMLDTRHRSSGYGGSGYLDQGLDITYPVLPGDNFGIAILSIMSNSQSVTYYNMLQVQYI